MSQLLCLSNCLPSKVQTSQILKEIDIISVNAPQSMQSDPLPDSINPSKALSQTDIIEKVHHLTHVLPPLAQIPIDYTMLEHRVTALRYLCSCYERAKIEGSQSLVSF